MRELGLDEDIVYPRLPERLSDARLVVMAPLVGGVDPPEAGLEGEPGQTRRLLLLPGGPVDQPRHLHALDVRPSRVHGPILAQSSGRWCKKPCGCAPSTDFGRATTRTRRSSCRIGRVRRG